ncbi:sensor domain-containing protein [Massilia sp. S19_KUP03_FR1]|uniref:sensor domain-containing protein n=1 Tax=Massilia sp. S19_KUP03_FR1 TaxID=3025503 RepID=UPI002FCCF074
MNHSPLPVAVFIVNAQGSIESWNQACADLARYGARNLRGSPIGRLLAFDHPGAAGSARAILPDAMPAFSDCIDTDATGQLLCLDGSKLPVRITVARQDLDPMQPSAFSVIVLPLTSHLPRRYAMLQGLPMADIVEGLPCVFYVIDASGKLILWNRQLEQALEMSSDEIEAAEIDSFFSVKEQPIAHENIRAAFEEGHSTHEAELIGKHGKRTACLFNCVRTTLGALPCIFGTGLDISARKKNELGLLVRERAMFSSVNAIVITCCQGGANAIEYINPAFEQITGYRLDDIKGRDPRFMHIAGTDVEQQQRIDDALARHESVHAVLRNLRKNGEIFWNDLYIDPVVDADGAVTHFVGVISDITEARHYERRLQHLAHHDPLTGLANRSLLQDRLQQGIDDALHHGRLGALAFLDVDNFKHINDTFGHEAGDDVLRCIAERLRHSLREDDTVARVGGDEFVLLINHQPSIRHVTDLVERVRQSLCAPIHAVGKEIIASASIGVALFPDNGVVAEQIMRAADAAMYHAKTMGKNNCQFYTPELNQVVHDNLLLEASLTRALRNHEMFLGFQPKIDLRSGAVVGAEALVRWQHPERGLIMPAAFIGAAEETGLIVPLGEWVLDAACAELAHLARRGFRQFVISVNLSARQLRQRAFPERVAGMLAKYGIAPATLELEVTESQLMDEPAQAIAALTSLKALGVQLSIDDFGTGYSSLSYLQRFPVDFIKIDKSFLADISDGDAIITRAIIALGHNLKLKVIAEGVETRAQLDFLREHDCDQMQGHYFSPAVGATVLDHMLARGTRLA